MKKAILTLVISFILVFQVSPAFCAIDIDATSYILIDAKSGSVLYEHDPDLKWRPASTTKIMTALVALKKGNPNELMTASLEDVSDIGVGGMNIGIMDGEQMYLKDLLNALLIVSANETANIISENTLSSKKDFIATMNSMATELGAKNTTFTNPCGIDENDRDKEHFTTSRDLAIIARECMTIPEFRKIVSQKTLNMLPATNKHDKWPKLSNTNKILGQAFSYGPTASDNSKKFTITGIKTGTTMRAGSNLVSSAINKDGLELISVVMGVTYKSKENVFAATQKLFKAGFENYSNQTVVERNTIIKKVKVVDAADDGMLDLVTNDTVEALLPSDANERKNIEPQETIQKNITAPIKKGTVLGNVKYLKNGMVIGKADIVASRTIDQSLKAKTRDFINKIASNKIFKICIAVAIVIICFLVLRKILRKISRNRRYKL